MRNLRAAGRGLVLGATTLGLYGLWLLGWPFAAMAGRRERWRAAIVRTWGRGALCGLGVHLTVAGTPPQPPFLLVSNHLGYLDIIVLAALTGATFLSKAEVARWPLVGLLARSMGTLFVNRDRKRDVPRVIADLEAHLALGRGVILFPEGTSTQGDRVLPFRSSFLEPAARAELPVSHAAIRYRTPAGERPASEAVCWWGDMPFLSHLVALLRLRRIEAAVAFGDAPLRHRDRKTLARELQSAVEARLPEEPHVR